MCDSFKKVTTYVPWFFPFISNELQIIPRPRPFWMHVLRALAWKKSKQCSLGWWVVYHQGSFKWDPFGDSITVMQLYGNVCRSLESILKTDTDWFSWKNEESPWFFWNILGCQKSIQKNGESNGFHRFPSGSSLGKLSRWWILKRRLLRLQAEWKSLHNRDTISNGFFFSFQFLAFLGVFWIVFRGEYMGVQI